MLKPQPEFLDFLLELMPFNLFRAFISTHICLLPQARNCVIQGAYEKCDDFTHILFIDDDMSNFGPFHLLKLLEADKPIVTAMTCMRLPPYSITAKFTEEELKEKKINRYVRNEEVRPVGHVGMAFTLIKREVLDATREETETDPVWFTNDRWPRPGFSEEIEEFIKDKLRINMGCVITKDNVPNWLKEAIAFGQTSHIGSRATGEDVAFCLKAEALGFQSYCHCGVSVGHIGTRIVDVGTNIEHNNPPPSGIPDGVAPPSQN